MTSSKERNRGIFLISILTWLILPANGADSTSNAPAPLTMRIRTDKSVSSDLLLRIELQNTSRVELETYTAKLPWENRYSMVLVLIKENSPELLPLTAPMIIDDPSPGRMVLRPGERIEGALNLSKRFPELQKLLEEQNVMLFWSYQFEPLKKPPLERLGGFLLLKQ